MTTLAAPSITLLPEAVWTDRARQHEARVRRLTDPHQDRASRGEPHPVWDFLFSYYAFRPAWLRRWHPGPDVVLGGERADEFLRWPAYRRTDAGVELNLAALPEKRRAFAVWLDGFLAAVGARPPAYGCHGMHEWAMVYREDPAAVRHSRWPLRFGPEEIARIVEASPLCCTHFDAFRFFTAAARPRNVRQPTRAGVADQEQRGCLHANMDLYKWAFKLAPYAPAELVAECFELAWDIRTLDMRASPYDLRALGFSAVAVETPAGRAEYEALQRGFTARADPLRERLRALCRRLQAG